MCTLVGVTENPKPDLATEEGRFAHNVRRMRESRGQSVAMFAEELRRYGLNNFHPTTVVRLESGQRKIALGEALVIAEVLATPVRVLASAPAALDRLRMFAMSHSITHQAAERIKRLVPIFEHEKEDLLGYADDAESLVASKNEDDWFDGGADGPTGSGWQVMEDARLIALRVKEARALASRSVEDLVSEARERDRHAPGLDYTPVYTANDLLGLEKWSPSGEHPEAP